MSVPVQVPISGPYTANGSTTQFAYQFYVLLATDLDVFVGGNKKILNTDYTVTQVGNTQGGNVVFTAAPAKNLEVLIKRNTPFTRQTDYADNGDLLADVLNADIDRLWLALQEINANFGSSISRPVGGNWTAQNLRLTMLADGTQPQDAVTYQQLFTVEGNAGQSAQAAAQSATDASTARQAAQTAAGNASTSETNSGNSAALARKWAAEVPDTVVADGLYSSRHYASKAATSASNASTSETNSASNAQATAADRTQTGQDRAASAQSAQTAQTEAAKLGNMNDLAASIQSVTSNNVLWKGSHQFGLGNTTTTTITAANGAASAPANSSTVSGGAVVSKYQVNGTDYVTSRLRAMANVSSAGAITRYTEIASGDGTNNAAWGFFEDGTLIPPGASLNAGKEISFASKAIGAKSLLNAGISGSVSGGSSRLIVPVSTTQGLCIQSGTAVITLNSSGETTYTFPTGFVSAISFTATNGDANVTGNDKVDALDVWNLTNTGVNIRVRTLTAGATQIGVPSGAFRMNWFASGLVNL